MITLVLFAWASEISLNSLLRAAALTGATSFVQLGELAWGARGRTLVMWSLFALLLAGRARRSAGYLWIRHPPSASSPVTRGSAGALVTSPPVRRA